jgi:hypothetical protein
MKAYIIFKYLSHPNLHEYVYPDAIDHLDPKTYYTQIQYSKFMKISLQNFFTNVKEILDSTFL